MEKDRNRGGQRTPGEENDGSHNLRPRGEDRGAIPLKRGRTPHPVARGGVHKSGGARDERIHRTGKGYKRRRSTRRRNGDMKDG